MPTYLELAYEGNYVGSWLYAEVFTYEGKTFFAFPTIGTVQIAPAGALEMALEI